MHALLISFCCILLLTAITCHPDPKTATNSLKDLQNLPSSQGVWTGSFRKRIKLSVSDENLDETATHLEDSPDEDYEEPNEENEDGEAETEGVGEKRKPRQRKKPIGNFIGTTYAWGKWEKWSRCTNTCVQIRKRQCIRRTKNSTDSVAEEFSFYPDHLAETTGCQGIMRKYRLCKDERCTKRSANEIRNEQCAAFNSIIIRGRFHQWLGHEKEHNECSLFCRAKDSELVVDMNKLVIDGTPCQRPSIYYTHYYRRKAVCVEGICRVSRVEHKAPTRQSSKEDQAHGVLRK